MRVHLARPNGATLTIEFFLAQTAQAFRAFQAARLAGYRIAWRGISS